MKLHDIKCGSVVAACVVAAACAPAQTLPVNGYTQDQNQLLLGFTTPPSTGDLVIDLGTPAQAGVTGTAVFDLIAHHNVGQTNSVFRAQLMSLYGGLGGLEWGVIGGSFSNASANVIYGTVPHGAAVPSWGAPGLLCSAINTVGGGIINFPGAVSNQGIVDPTQDYGESWTEQAVSVTGEWEKNATSPIVTTPTTFGASGVQYSLADLYVRSNSVANTPSYKGYFTLGSDGSLTFTPGTNAAPVTPPPAPRLAITRSGNTSTISFGTTNGAVYSLRFTNAAGLSSHVDTRPLSATTVTGNGLTNSITDTTTDATRFYRVTAN